MSSNEVTVRRRKFPRPSPASRASTFELVVLEGPPGARGKRLTIEETSNAYLLVGRSPLSALVLDDPEVAAKQCSLRVVDGRLAMADLGSNRTRVNGVFTREAFLSGGEIVRLGDCVIGVHRHDELGGVAPEAVAFGRLYAESEAVRSQFPAFARAAAAHGPLLVEGEAGVGKQLLAEEIHRQSLGETAPFILFSERGAPSEAIVAALFAKGGLVDQARGGTLFLEEVRDLDHDAQQMLATVIEATAHDREPGGRGVRFMLATRGGPPLAEELGALVEPTRIVLPPLRDRHGDAYALARSFWTELGGVGSVPEDLTTRFDDRAWPGNVRELRIAVQDHILHGHEATHEAAHEAAHESERPARRPAPLLPDDDPLARVIQRDLPFVEARNQLMAEFERRYIYRALARAGQNVTRAARASGIAPRYFQVLRSRHRSA
jgi:DNA-binding NtrC family response regulator